MARYDVHRTEFGLLLDVQNDLIEDFKTRVVVPLLPESATPPRIGRLHPVFEVSGQRYVMATHLLSAVSVHELGGKADNLLRQHDDITRALDLLFQGV
ncbi:MAG: CcdB family protein [Rhizobiaceae bacterium]